MDRHFGKVQCETCEDENQPNSTDDEVYVETKTRSTGRTWVVEPVERLRKPKPKRRHRGGRVKR